MVHTARVPPENDPLGPVLNVPNAGCPITRGSHDQTTVLAERDVRQGLTMPGQRSYDTAILDRPNPRGSVERTGRYEPSIGAEGRRAHSVLVAGENSELGAVCLPKSRRIIVQCREDEPAIGAEQSLAQDSVRLKTGQL